MEKYLSSSDKEVMKAAMMRHEETFKEQVYELHRLYQIQRTLMNSLEINGRNRRYSESKWRSTNNIAYQQTDQARKRSKSKINLSKENFIESSCGQIGENEIVLTLGLAPSTRSFSSASSGSNRVNRAFGDFNSRQVASNDVEDQLNRERLKQPSWLIKVLSL